MLNPGLEMIDMDITMECICSLIFSIMDPPHKNLCLLF